MHTEDIQHQRTSYYKTKNHMYKDWIYWKKFFEAEYKMTILNMCKEIK